MKNKKIFMYIGIIFLILIVLGLGMLVYINNKNNKHGENVIEYTPQEEITDKQLRQTIITLYFYDKEKETLMPEARKIDSKRLLENPYRNLVELLIEGPKNEKLIKLIPEGTMLNSVEIKEGTVYIDFSNNFIEEQNLGKEKEMLIINSILNTLTELTEVNSIRILINGIENESFSDKEVIFTENFIKNN